MITYHLVPDNEKQDLNLILKKISDYLTSFTGDITVKFRGNKLLIISYPNASYTAECKIDDKKVVLNTFEDDSVTINLLKNVSSNSGFRIFNTKGYFLPNDPKLMDVSSIGIKREVMDIFKEVNLIPLFQYRDSLIFFCINKKKEVCLINRHYLEFLLISSPQSLISNELFVEVSPDISTFIALFDRGLISLVFPKYQDSDTKITNLSGFNIDKLDKNTSLQVTNFRLDKEKQTFVQESTTEKIVNKNYLSLKVGQDYSYREIDKKLYKIINMSCFY